MREKDQKRKGAEEEQDMERKNQSAQDCADLQSLTARVDRQRPFPLSSPISVDNFICPGQQWCLPFTRQTWQIQYRKVTLMRLTGGFTRPEPQRNVHLLAFSNLHATRVVSVQLPTGEQLDTVQHCHFVQQTNRQMVSNLKQQFHLQSLTVTLLQCTFF
ncbi:hypothetical protein T07_7640 [Trichinella nelsoni]|uniref:Uncharacterized protein n=1 Tax=Trichinella nelsoni TaxID=6336 RepID=A0A0V0S0N0_9BILA|nr:hypothetical protein T07_7640 [Trichinella nelsoni]